MIIKSYKHNYEVKIEDDFDIKKYIDNENCFFVIDKNVYELYKNHFIGIKQNKLYIFDAIESNKNLDAVIDICDRFTDISAKKNAVLLSFGGGITQDVTGFVANILYRGIKWIFYPTTLLAACDSCVGSKTSLNFKNYKNLIGTFYPPSEIVINSSCFKTLTNYDLASGLGEIVKFNVLRGVGTIAKLEDDIEKLIALNLPTIKAYIENSLTFKKEFVETDEFDNGIRVKLNFAHTFGHSIETASDYMIPHGTAVAIGTVIANYISMQRKLLPKNIYDRIVNLVKQIVFINVNCVDFNKIIMAIKNDKKQISNDIRAILLDGNFDLNVIYLSEKEIIEAFSEVWKVFS